LNLAMSGSLTKKQRALVKELKEMRALLDLDFERISDYPSDARTVKLQVMRNKIVRGQVIVWYTLIDEFLANRICRFFFGRTRSFPQLWRTKRFRLFNHHVIEQLSLLEKLRLVKAIDKLPKAISSDIESLNNLRNGLAHSFFPENLRSAKPIWKGKDVFSLDGITRLDADMQAAFNYFWPDEI
jgi:hypothetical protein